MVFLPDALRAILSFVDPLGSRNPVLLLSTQEIASHDAWQGVLRSRGQPSSLHETESENQ